MKRGTNGFRSVHECADCGEVLTAANVGALKAKMAYHATACEATAPPVKLTNAGAGVPWSDPESDPMGDMVRAARQAGYAAVATPDGLVSTVTRYRCWTCRGLTFEGDPADHLAQQAAAVAPARTAVLAFR